MNQTVEAIDQLERQMKSNNHDQKVTKTSEQDKIINEIKKANKIKALCPEISLITLR